MSHVTSYKSIRSPYFRSCFFTFLNWYLRVVRRLYDTTATTCIRYLGVRWVRVNLMDDISKAALSRGRFCRTKLRGNIISFCYRDIIAIYGTLVGAQISTKHRGPFLDQSHANTQCARSSSLLSRGEEWGECSPSLTSSNEFMGNNMGIAMEQWDVERCGCITVRKTLLEIIK